MRKILTLLAASALMIGFQSCEELAITFEDVVLEKVLSINNLMTKSVSVVSDTKSYTFSESATFSLGDANSGNNSEQDLMNYLDVLTSVNIKSMVFMLQNIPGDQSITINSLNISISSGRDTLYSEQFTNITPNTPVNAADLNSSAFSEISKRLLDNKDLTIRTSGEVEGNVESFEIATQIISDIEANAIDAIKSVI